MRFLLADFNPILPDGDLRAEQEFCKVILVIHDARLVIHPGMEETEAEAKSMKTLIVAVASVLGWPVLAALAADLKVDLGKLPPPSEQKGLTYAKDMRPIFEKHCFKCHDPEKHKGKLRLDSLEAALKGGEDGKVIEPGKSAQSMLVRKVAHLAADEDDWMPPTGKGEALTKEQVSLIRAWIDQGAK
jgi:hypothetical protein